MRARRKPLSNDPHHVKCRWEASPARMNSRNDYRAHVRRAPRQGLRRHPRVHRLPCEVRRMLLLMQRLYIAAVLSIVDRN
jgi:hypothetical protein